MVELGVINPFLQCAVHLFLRVNHCCGEVLFKALPVVELLSRGALGVLDRVAPLAD